MSPTNSSPYSSTDFQRAEIEPSLSALQQALALIQPELCMAASGTKSDHNGARSRTPPLQPLSGGDVIGIKAGVARHRRRTRVSGVDKCGRALCRALRCHPSRLILHMSPPPGSPCHPPTCGAALVRVKPAEAPSGASICEIHGPSTPRVTTPPFAWGRPPRVSWGRICT